MDLTGKIEALENQIMETKKELVKLRSQNDNLEI